MNPEVWWYLSRAAGIVAYMTLTVSVLWGIGLAAGAFRSRRRAWVLDLHRWLGGLTLFFLAGHLAALVADSSVAFGLRELLVPFASSWNPAAVALGVVALWLVLAVQGTSLAIRRFSRRAWRGVHLLGYVVFWLTSVHGALAGTDSSRTLYVAATVLAISAVVGATCYRIMAPGGSARRGVTSPRERGVVSPERELSSP
jgi:DMSO/TMAO reductase YedYZ heme-binding membrane subunit